MKANSPEGPINARFVALGKARDNYENRLFGRINQFFTQFEAEIAVMYEHPYGSEESENAFRIATAVANRIHGLCIAIEEYRAI